MRRFGLVDLLVGFLVVLFGISFGIAQVAVSREQADRTKCAQNLRQIGQAIMLYANENRGAYPRTIAAKLAQGEKDPVPVWGTPYEGNKDLVPPDKQEFAANPFVSDDPARAEDKDLLQYRPAPNDVTAALFLLMRTQDITSQPFVCPSTGLDKFEFGGGTRTARHWNNWPGKDGLKNHLSYSYQNAYPSVAAIGAGFKLNYTISSEFAVMADMNPGGDALLKLTPKSPPAEQREGNSFNHDRDGQNVLYGDGHVEWMHTPFASTRRDNIFTFGKSGVEVADKGGDGIVGSPVGPEDSILLPTARDVGQVNEKGEFIGAPTWQPPTRQQADALRNKLAGEYQQAGPNGVTTLSVTRDQLVATSGPVAVTFTYAITGLSPEGEAQLALAAPQTKGETARVQVAENGDLVITRNRYYQGNWKRKR